MLGGFKSLHPPLPLAGGLVGVAQAPGHLAKTGPGLTFRRQSRRPTCPPEMLPVLYSRVSLNHAATVSDVTGDHRHEYRR
jgi:hypothetical protein